MGKTPQCQDWAELLRRPRPLACRFRQTGDSTIGRTLIVYLCVFLSACAIVFLVSFLRLWRGALGQGLPPAIALLATALL
ncbi:hypothetical protein [Streptomyces sp. Ag109_G2-15]|uniref:hypothetical protein n=1 Tax=Streptomyces sp. Ag109_G2-15 TaxID=1938850 RepID=UPI000BC99DFD|nr:hypothetical protein [Streptomyces sp. Ag109_G2-15]SOE06600.1 hypothetical protein SAMN06272765_7438 [Streptomyces sp. Ag109_G2-15]